MESKGHVSKKSFCKPILWKMTPIQLKPTKTSDKGVVVSELEYVFKDL